MMKYINLLFDRQLVVSVLTAIAVFATVLTLAYPWLAGDKLASRLKSVATRREELRRLQREALNKKGQQAPTLRSTPVGFMKSTIEKLNLRNILESANTKEKLSRAGYRGQAAIYTFMFFRFVMPFILFLSAIVYLFLMSSMNLPPLGKVGIAFGAAFLGFYLPDLYVQNVIDKRMSSILKAFPDALDLLLICVESGMSVEAAFNKVASEIGTQSVELAEEFALTTAELSYLPDRRQAYENLGKRCAHPGEHMTALVFIFVGIAIGAALIGVYLFGRERGRAGAIEDVARTIGGKLVGRAEGERTQAEMVVVGETETNADGTARQDIIAKLAVGEDVELVRDRANAHEPSAVRVVSRRGEIGQLARTDADRLAPYLDGGGRVGASIAFINGGTSTNTALNVVVSVVALDG